jgi:hypothetical protein
MKLLISVLLSLVYVNTNAQVGPTRNWVDSEVNYTDSKGNTITVTNSLPKGGGVVDKNGKKYGYRVFWTRIRNKSATPINFKVKFPDATFFKSVAPHIKIILTNESMTLGKTQLYDYGLTNIQSLVNENFNPVISLQKKINPQEEYFFYVPVLIYEDRGAARASLILKGQKLYYKINIGSKTALIPCGSLDFKN